MKTHLQVSTWRVKKNTHNCMGCMAFPFHVINVMVSCGFSLMFCRNFNGVHIKAFEFLSTSVYMNQNREFDVQ